MGGSTVHHYASDQIVQDLSPFFVQCATKAGEKPGNEARLLYSPFHFISIIFWFLCFWFLCWTQLPSFCFTVQVMMVIKMPFQTWVVTRSPNGLTTNCFQ